MSLGNDQFDLGRAAQWRQLDPAIVGAEAPGQQTRQHARVPGVMSGTEQGDAPRRPLDQGPAAQHTEVRVAGTNQD